MQSTEPNPDAAADELPAASVVAAGGAPAGAGLPVADVDATPGAASGVGEAAPAAASAAVDVAQLAAVEIIGVYAADLMTAAAVKLGLFEGGEAYRDLAEARILITALAGFVDAAAPEVGHHHAAPLRDGLTTLQRAFREYSPVPDAPGSGPGEAYTGPVF